MSVLRRAPVRLVPVLLLLLTALPLLLTALLPLSPAEARISAASTAALSVSPPSGTVGATMTLQGTRFRARTRGVVTVGAASYGVATDGRGAFRLAATVPSGSPAGRLAVVARVGTVSASTSFLVTSPEVQEPVAARLRFGVTTPGGPSATAELDAVAALAGEAPTVVLSYADFTRELDSAGLQSVSARGAVPLVTWEPWVAGAGAVQPAYALDRITAGDFDPYLRRWADGLRGFGRPVMLRFAHEMNGDWYPWSEAVNGNRPGDYVAAWRHVHSVVTTAGATNVSWVWSPNVPYAGSVPLAGLYPGAASVDVVALDGYNFGTSQSWSTWTGPEELFGPGLTALRALAPGLPVLVAETASSELGGDKAAWVRALFAYLAGQPDVTGVVWFDHHKETDWRLGSSPTSATAVREALLARRAAG